MSEFERTIEAMIIGALIGLVMYCGIMLYSIR
jgi:hypothetical protein